jgi:SAM-dependent methyltransferase
MLIGREDDELCAKRLAEAESHPGSPVPGLRACAPGEDELVSAINSYRPTGDVLELACGLGLWTERLQRSAASVTAVDAAPEMRARARTRLGSSASVRFVEAGPLRVASGSPVRYRLFWLLDLPRPRGPVRAVLGPG